MKIEGRGDGDSRSYERAHGPGEFALQVIDAIDHSGTMEIKKDSVHGQGFAKAAEEPSFYLLVAFPINGSRRLGPGVKEGEGGPAALGAEIEGSAALRLRPGEAIQALPFEYAEVLQRGRCAAVSVGFVNDPADGNAHVLCSPRPRPMLTVRRHQEYLSPAHGAAFDRDRTLGTAEVLRHQGDECRIGLPIHRRRGDLRASQLPSS